MRIWVPGLPVAQPRVKATVRGKHAGVYTPKTADAWKAQIVEAWHNQDDGFEPLHASALRVAIFFHMPRPKSHYGTGKNADKLKPSAPQHPITKPDIDNLGKAVLDALKGHAWRDDSQVVHLDKRKDYARGQPGCSITVEQIEEF